MERELREKHSSFENILKGYEKVAIAFSGGVDSSLLLYSAGKVLGKNKVLALHGVSCLNHQIDVQGAKDLYRNYCADSSQYREIELHPLLWKEFVINNEDRCYFCKKRIYSIFKMEMEKEGCELLLDGTNKDDLKDHRPGFRAIRELGVHTPLLQAGLNKQEIRKFAKEFGLPNYDLPSNSCLATRIEKDTAVDENLLTVISKAEHYLNERGFCGNRVRPRGGKAIIEVQNKDIESITKRSVRVSILHYFQAIGFDDIFLDLQGRI